MDTTILNPAAKLPRRFCAADPQVKVFSWEDGTRIALDCNSLCAVSVDVDTADKLKADTADGEFCGLLYSKIAPTFTPPVTGPVRKIVFNLTHGCNLKCGYCFASVYKSSEALPMKIADKALRMFGDKSAIDIAFFGGEPILAWARLVEIAERAHELAHIRGVKCKLHVTTNGTLIDDIKAVTLKRLGVSVLISLDGPEDIHNSNRPARQGNSFEQTIAGLESLKKAGLRPMVRATFTESEIDIAGRLDFFHDLYERGMISGVSIEPAVLSEGCGAMPATAVDKEALADAWHSAAVWYAEKFNSLPPDARPVPLFYFRKLAKRLMDYQWMGNECGAGRGYMTVGPDGGLYACHRETGTLIGDIENGIDEDKRKPWAGNCLAAHKECQKCWARYLCGGGCPQARIAVGESLSAAMPTICAAKRIMIKEVLWLLAHLTPRQTDMLLR